MNQILEALEKRIAGKLVPVLPNDIMIKIGETITETSLTMMEIINWYSTRYVP